MNTQRATLRVGLATCAVLCAIITRVVTSWEAPKTDLTTSSESSQSSDVYFAVDATSTAPTAVRAPNLLPSHPRWVKYVDKVMSECLISRRQTFIAFLTALRACAHRNQVMLGCGYAIPLFMRRHQELPCGHMSMSVSSNYLPAEDVKYPSMTNFTCSCYCNMLICQHP